MKARNNRAVLFCELITEFDEGGLEAIFESTLSPYRTIHLTERYPEGTNWAWKPEQEEEN